MFYFKTILLFQSAYNPSFGDNVDDNESDSCSDFDEDEDPDKIEVPGKFL